MPAPSVKTCKGCGRSKPTEEFGIRSENRDGRDNLSMICRRSGFMSWKKEHPDRVDRHNVKASLQRQHGPEAATPEQIAGKMEELHRARE